MQENCQRQSTHTTITSGPVLFVRRDTISHDGCYVLVALADIAFDLVVALLYHSSPPKVAHRLYATVKYTSGPPFTQLGETDPVVSDATSSQFQRTVAHGLIIAPPETFVYTKEPP